MRHKAARKQCFGASTAERRRAALSRGVVLGAVLLLLLPFPSYGSEKPWKALDWTAIRGVNFIPGYARNAYETWTKYDAEATAREPAVVAARRKAEAALSEISDRIELDIQRTLGGRGLSLYRPFAPEEYDALCRGRHDSSIRSGFLVVKLP